MDATLIIMQTTIPWLIVIGLAGLAGTTTIGRRRQKMRVRVKKRS